MLLGWCHLKRFGRRKQKSSLESLQPRPQNSPTDKVQGKSLSEQEQDTADADPLRLQLLELSSNEYKKVGIILHTHTPNTHTHTKEAVEYLGRRQANLKNQMECL